MEINEIRRTNLRKLVAKYEGMNALARQLAQIDWVYANHDPGAKAELARRIARAGKRANRQVQSWAVDGSLYFSVTGGLAIAAPEAVKMEIGKKSGGNRSKKL